MGYDDDDPVVQGYIRVGVQYLGVYTWTFFFALAGLALETLAHLYVTVSYTGHSGGTTPSLLFLSILSFLGLATFAEASAQNSRRRGHLLRYWIYAQWLVKTAMRAGYWFGTYALGHVMLATLFYEFGRLGCLFVALMASQTLYKEKRGTPNADVLVMWASLLTCVGYLSVELAYPHPIAFGLASAVYALGMSSMAVVVSLR